METNAKKKAQLIQALNKVDFYFLKAIFDMRCLTPEQAWRAFYKPRGIAFQRFARGRLTPLISNGVLELNKVSKYPALFLTDLGVSLVREEFGICNEIYDMHLGRNIKDGISASSLKLLPKLIPHQVHLNQFILNFKSNIASKKPQAKFQYFNEKYASQYNSIRPDGIIRMNTNVDFLLEMDMGTESNKQLQDKWAKYCRHMNKYANLPNQKKVVVLFIIHCERHKIEARKELVRKSLSDTFMDLFDKNFEVYIGTCSELTEAVFNKVIPNLLNSDFFEEKIMARLVNQKHGFTVTSGQRVQQRFSGVTYQYYIRKINSNNKIVKSNGRVQEFLFDEYFYSPVSVLGRIQLIHRTSTTFHLEYGRKIEYIILVSNVKEMYYQLASTKLLETPGVFFTTIERLNKCQNFHDALFKYQEGGDIYSPCNDGYVKLKFEGNIFSGD